MQLCNPMPPVSKIAFVASKKTSESLSFCFLWIRKAALGSSPGDCCNRRGFSAEKRIHLPPPAIRQAKACLFAFCGFERRLLATVRWTVATAVAFPQKSESTFPHQKSTGLDRDLSFFTYSLFIIHFSLFILLQVFALLFSFALNIMYTSRHLNQRSDTHEIHHQGGL